MSYQVLPTTLTAVGVGLVGIGTGLALSYNLILFPTIDATPGLSATQKLAAWKGGYDAGIRTIVPLPLLGAVLFATAAVLKQDAASRSWLPAAAFFGVGHLLITTMTMLPTNNRLIALHKRTALMAAEDQEVESLLAKWLSLHTLRVASMATSTALGLRALVAMR